MNLNQLRFVSAVAASGSFTAAAEQCFVTQPTLSNGIAQLENELGARLFVRTTRQVALTSFGAHVLPYLLEVLNAQAALMQQTSAFLSADKRVLRIGTSPLINGSVLGAMLETFRQKHPEIEIILREMNMMDLYNMLDDSLLDVIFVASNMHKGPWDSSFLYEEPLLFIPKGGVWRHKNSQGTVQLKDISTETFVMVPDACGLSRTTRALFRSQRLKLQEYPGQAMSYQVLEEWAGLGIGAAILPKSKIASSKHNWFSISDQSSNTVKIRFEASWARHEARESHLTEFIHHVLTTVSKVNKAAKEVQKKSSN